MQSGLVTTSERTIERGREKEGEEIESPAFSTAFPEGVKREIRV